MSEDMDIGGNARKALMDYVSRVETINVTIDDEREGIKNLLAQAKADGFSKRAIRKVVAERRKDPDKRKAELDEDERYAAVFGL